MHQVLYPLVIIALHEVYIIAVVFFIYWPWEPYLLFFFLLLVSSTKFCHDSYQNKIHYCVVYVVSCYTSLLDQRNINSLHFTAVCLLCQSVCLLCYIIYNGPFCSYNMHQCRCWSGLSSLIFYSLCMLGQHHNEAIEEFRLQSVL